MADYLSNSEYQDIVEESDSIDENFSSYSKTHWPECLEVELMKEARRLNCHLDTKVKKHIKWDQLRKALEIHPNFVGQSVVISTANVKAKVNRILAKISKKYAINEEGANLSGLPENMTAFEALVMLMLEEQSKQKASAQAAQIEERKRQQSMFCHEKKTLIRTLPPRAIPIAPRNVTRTSAPSPESFRTNLNLVTSIDEDNTSPAASSSLSRLSSCSPAARLLEAEHNFWVSLMNRFVEPETNSRPSSTISHTTPEDLRRLELELEIKKVELLKIQEQRAMNKELELIEDRKSRKRSYDESSSALHRSFLYSSHQL